MTSREIVKKAIHFKNPPRIPFNFDSNRIPAGCKEYGDDLIWVFAEMQPLDQNGKNEWGVAYVTLDNSFGEPKTHPLAGRDSMDGYTFPDFSLEWRYEETRRVIKQNKGEKYILGMLPCGMFQHMIDLFGFQDFLINVAAEKELIWELGGKLLEIGKTAAKKMAESGVDGIITIDDTALQDRLMISMEDFDQLFLPRFKELYSYCHSLGLDSFIHSCGYTIDLIEKLMEAGCDVFNLDQQDNMGLQNLSEKYQGRTCFFCPLDIQRTPELSESGIRERVRELVGALATPEGGFIAKTYPQPEAIGITHDYMRIMTSEFKSRMWN